MKKTDIEHSIQWLKEETILLKKALGLEKQRTDRIVQVLLHNLPKKNLDKEINFSGRDCCGSYRDWDAYLHGRTLRDFLNYVVDP